MKNSSGSEIEIDWNEGYVLLSNVVGSRLHSPQGFLISFNGCPGICICVLFLVGARTHECDRDFQKTQHEGVTKLNYATFAQFTHSFVPVKARHSCEVHFSNLVIVQLFL